MSRVRDIANIMSGNTSMATDAEVTSAISAQFVAGKNKIINGDFSVWQRGTSFSPNAYCADRWISDTNSTGTITRQTFTPGSAPVAGYEGANFLRFTKNAGGGQMVLFQRIEDVRTLAGQTITLSFWAKADSNVTAGTWMTWRMGSGGNGDFGAGFGSPFNITTSWQRFSATYTMPQLTGVTIGTSSYIEPQFIRIFDSLAHTVDIWGCQLEAGSVATAFTTSTGNPQGELAACQRYFQSYGGSTVYERFSAGFTPATTSAYFVRSPLVQMRATPSLSYSALSDWNVELPGVAGVVPTALDVTWSGTSVQELVATFASNATYGGNKGCLFRANNTTNARLYYSAEL
jgi:hypothetical protein